MAAHPYQGLAPAHFWRTQVSSQPLDGIDYDCAPRFGFELERDLFATAGSCFAQHFGRALTALGGKLYLAEAKHPLLPETSPLGYGTYSARYGNIYTPRQLRELVEQAFGRRDPIFDLVQSPDGRWRDLLRPAAVGPGFSSEAEARADRLWHLRRVRAMFDEATVFVFTLGLTECWKNVAGDYVYPMCPGTVAGTYDPALHRFHNQGFAECVEDLGSALQLALSANPNLKVLLTVSPVMLVATFDPRGALQSSVVSKSILRAAAEACREVSPRVDYFPSYEIICGPQARGRFYDESGREVTAEGVDVVMRTFLRSRLNLEPERAAARVAAAVPPPREPSAATRLLQAECDELLLDPGRGGSR